MDGARAWYFGYGSNMSRAVFCGRRGMRPLESRWGWLADWRLRFNIPVGPGERAVANLSPEAGARVCGVLWRLPAEQLDPLDRSEGVHRGLYRRVPVVVAAPGGEAVEAFTYVSAIDASGRRASPRYLGLLLDGAREHGLPGEWIDYLNGLERAVDERVAASSGTSTQRVPR